MTVEMVVKENITIDNSLKKLIEIQKELIYEGYTLEEYEKYFQENIENNYFHYRNLNEDNTKFLVKRFNRLLNKDYKDHSMNRRQRKLYREKRKRLCDEKKRELIDDLIHEINKLTTRDLSILSNDPEQWNETKKLLFVGGKYLEGIDKKWCNIYHKLTSQNSANLFDLISNDDLVNYVYDN